MTVSISASRSSSHTTRTLVQKLRWIPDNDDGAEFVPGHWSPEGEPAEIDPGAAFTAAMTDEDGGYAVHIWQEASQEG